MMEEEEKEKKEGKMFSLFYRSSDSSDFKLGDASYSLPRSSIARYHTLKNMLDDAYEEKINFSMLSHRVSDTRRPRTNDTCTTRGGMQAA
jgi:hypothetical protein